MAFFRKNYIVIIATIVSVSLPFAASAALSLSSAVKKYDAYGGTITQMKYCSCVYDLAELVTIKDKVSGKELKIKYSLYYSTIHKYYALFKSSNVVGGGTTAGNLTCLQQSGYYCKDNGTADVLVDLKRGIGTSLPSKSANLSF